MLAKTWWLVRSRGSAARGTTVAPNGPGGGASWPATRAVPEKTVAARAEEDAGSEAQPSQMHAGALALLFLWLGTISVGGRSISYIRDEVVERRKWMRIPEFMEAMSFALVMPGPTGPNLALFVGRMLRGKLAGTLAAVAYVLPGAAIILLLTIFMRGAGAGSLGLLVTICIRNVGIARTARCGLALALLAAIATGVLGLPLVGVLLGLGGLSLYLNRPTGAEE
jgi:chromate transporter